MYFIFLLFCPQGYPEIQLFYMYHISYLYQFNNHDTPEKKKDSFDMTSTIICSNPQIPPIYGLSLTSY